MPQVSVIVPNFNHASFLRKRLESIINQSFSDFEIIILDDASTDSSKNIIEDYHLNDKVTHIEYNSQNSGIPFKQWQKGIELAQGELIWIAESDDYNDPGFLKKMVEMASTYPRCNLFASNLIVVDENDLPTGRQTRYKSEVIGGSHAVLRLFGLGNYLWNASSVVFRKTAAHGANWDIIQKMRFCGDWQFYVSILVKGPITTTSECLSFFRMHHQTVTGSPESKYLHFDEGLTVVNYILDHVKASWISRLTLCTKWLLRLIKSELPRPNKQRIRYRIRFIFGNLFFLAYGNSIFLMILERVKQKILEIIAR